MQAGESLQVRSDQSAPFIGMLRTSRSDFFFELTGSLQLGCQDSMPETYLPLQPQRLECLMLANCLGTARW